MLKIIATGRVQGDQISWHFNYNVLGQELLKKRASTMQLEMPVYQEGGSCAFRILAVLKTVISIVHSGTIISQIQWGGVSLTRQIPVLAPFSKHLSTTDTHGWSHIFLTLNVFILFNPLMNVGEDAVTTKTLKDAVPWSLTRSHKRAP